MPSNVEQAEGEWIWAPPGFAHGNLFPQPTQIQYFCSGPYSPGCEAGISLLAADIDWSLCDPQCKAMLDCTAAGPLLMSDKGPPGPERGAIERHARGENFIYGQC